MDDMLRLRLETEARAYRFNPNHAPAGSPAGGQFATSSGSGQGGKRPSNPARARTKSRLLRQAASDEEQVRQLRKQLSALLHQQAQANATAATHHRAATARTAAAKGKQTKQARQHRQAAQHHTRAHTTARAKATALATQIAGVRHRIATLDAQAKADRRAAAKL